MALAGFYNMKTYKHLYSQLCSYENLELAYKKARKGKTLKPYVVEFEKDLQNNLHQLERELRNETYKPRPLKSFILRDPKTRKISVSDFRDRVVHHALCNLLIPIYEKVFIHDSYANRIGKGTLAAIKRYDYFKRKTRYVFKADLKHYFETVNHGLLLRILSKKIQDRKVLNLIRKILSNYNAKTAGKGMPLGNLTSQFFANVYLNEMDYFIKQELRVEYYVRYVDDFVIFDKSKERLENCKEQINTFLQKRLALQLHPHKSKIISLQGGVGFLGLKIFIHHKLIKKGNLRKFQRKLRQLCLTYDQGLIDYDAIYNFLEGWMAYARNANTYKWRGRITSSIEERFVGEISTKEIDRYCI